MAVERSRKLKIVFLDIDGVIVNRASLRIASGLSAKGHPDCVAALNYITNQTGARIVVSSTWRMLGTFQMKDILSSWGVDGIVLGSTPDLTRQQGSIALAVARGTEIQAWLDEFNENRHGVESFVILDDGNDMAHLVNRLVRTEFEIGLTMADAQRAVELLSVSVEQ